MKVLVNKLNDDQKIRILEYLNPYDPNPELRRGCLLLSDGFADKGKYIYTNAHFIINDDALKTIISSDELNDIFYEGNYTIEDRINSKN